MSDLVKQAMAELADVVRCRCHEAYTGRGLHDPECQCYSGEAVKVVTHRIEELEAQLAEVTAYFDDLRTELNEQIKIRVRENTRAEAAEEELMAAQGQIADAQAAEAALPRVYRMGLEDAANRIQKKIAETQPELSRRADWLSKSGKPSVSYAIERAAMDARNSDRDMILAIPTPTDLVERSLQETGQ